MLEATARKGKGFIPAADLIEADVDPLVWPAVQRINQSGWVTTELSCQGHPEDPADPNQHPMLRLRCGAANRGRLLAALADASQYDDSHIGPYAATLKLWRDPWSLFIVTIYVEGVNHQVELGVLDRFSRLVNA